MRGRSIAVLGFLTVLAGADSSARAQGEDALVNELVEANKKALAVFAEKDFDGAKQILLDAVVKAKKSGIGSHKMVARTYLHLGAVFVDGLKDKDKGIRYLVLGLRVRPDIQLTPSLVTPNLTEAFEEAQLQATGKAPAEASGAAEPAPPKPALRPVATEPAAEDAPPPPTSRARRGRRASGEPDLPASVPDPLYCPNPDEAPPEQAIVLRCVTQADVRPARVLLFYRPPGSEEFTSVPATKTPKGWYLATIPGEVATEKSIQYYFEARSAADQVLAEAGRVDSPNLMLLTPGAPPVGGNMLATRRASAAGEEGGAADEPEDPLQSVKRQRAEEELAAERHRRGPGQFWAGIGAGSGFGWHGARSVEFLPRVRVNAGWSPAGIVHFAPEVGYQWTNALAFSLQARIQMIPEEGSGDVTKGHPARGAFLVLAKMYAIHGEKNFQWFWSGMAGAGDGFRMVVPPHPMMCAATDMKCVDQRRNDTLRGGPVVFGAGAGIIYHFTPWLALVLEVKPLIGLPDFAFVVDAAAGPQVSF